MKKEVFIAIIVGFSLGLIITFGIHTARQSLDKRDQHIADQTSPEDNSPSEDSSNHTLNITSPSINQIVDESVITVTGITSPNAMIATLSTSSENISVADDQGNFSSQVEVSAGANHIKIVSYHTTGESKEDIISVVYSTADLDGDSVTEEVDES